MFFYSVFSIYRCFFAKKWAIPEKNPNRKVDDMEFLGVLKKKHVEIPGVN